METTFPPVKGKRFGGLNCLFLWEISKDGKRVDCWVVFTHCCFSHLFLFRQLLVIARALLDGAAVVICDEATAAIDAEADARIQRILRTDFAKATTLTVAHRLNTIMDSTHILVMDDGKAAEFDTPSNLLAKGGLFKDLVDKWEEEQEG